MWTVVHIYHECGSKSGGRHSEQSVLGDPKLVSCILHPPYKHVCNNATGSGRQPLYELLQLHLHLLVTQFLHPILHRLQLHRRNLTLIFLQQGLEPNSLTGRISILTLHVMTPMPQILQDMASARTSHLVPRCNQLFSKFGERQNVARCRNRNKQNVRHHSCRR